MNIVQIKVPLDSHELDVLAEMAHKEEREPYQQLRWFFLEKARERNLLPQDRIATEHDQMKAMEEANDPAA